MFKVNRKITYALTALKYMKSRDKKELTTAKGICQRFSVPFDPMSRALQIMAQNALLEAEQGAHGGYRLARGIEGVSLYDLSVMIVGPLKIAECCIEEGDCERLEVCVLKGSMEQLNKKVVQVFKDVMIEDMLKAGLSEGDQRKNR